MFNLCLGPRWTPTSITKFCFKVSSQQTLKIFCQQQKAKEVQAACYCIKRSVPNRRKELSAQRGAPLLQPPAADSTHLLVTVETARVAEALLLAFMEEVLHGHALIVYIKSTVVTTVGFQPLGGSELGEAGVAANAVNYIPIADLMLDLQKQYCCHSHRTP